MLEIKTIEEKSEQEKICLACGVKYKPELFAYKAYEGGALIAVSQFDIEGKDAVIYDMKQVAGAEYDFEAMFILGRAVLNFLDLCGVERVYFDTSEEGNEKMAKLVGFKNEGGRYGITLTGLFTEPCSHGDGYKGQK